MPISIAASSTGITGPCVLALESAVFLYLTYPITPAPRNMSASCASLSGSSLVFDALAFGPSRTLCLIGDLECAAIASQSHTLKAIRIIPPDVPPRRCASWRFACMKRHSRSIYPGKYHSVKTAQELIMDICEVNGSSIRFPLVCFKFEACTHDHLTIFVSQRPRDV